MRWIKYLVLCPPTAFALMSAMLPSVGTCTVLKSCLFCTLLGVDTQLKAAATLSIHSSGSPSGSYPPSHRKHSGPLISSKSESSSSSSSHSSSPTSSATGDNSYHVYIDFLAWFIWWPEILHWTFLFKQFKRFSWSWWRWWWSQWRQNRSNWARLSCWQWCRGKCLHFLKRLLICKENFLFHIWCLFSTWLPVTSISLHCFSSGLERGWNFHWLWE